MANTLRDRFWKKVDRRGEDDCWPWLAATNRYGYGRIQRGRRGEGVLHAHQASYELERGPVPVGHEVHHLCENRICVNPAHLRVVTHRENVLLGAGPTAVNARKTHCKRGHPLTGENLSMDNGQRRCLTCRRAQARERARQRRAPS